MPPPSSAYPCAGKEAVAINRLFRALWPLFVAAILLALAIAALRGAMISPASLVFD